MIEICQPCPTVTPFIPAAKLPATLCLCPVPEAAPNLLPTIRYAEEVTDDFEKVLRGMMENLFCFVPE